MLSMLLAIGILFLFAIAAGRLSTAIGVPRVTGYLVTGILAGPSLAGMLGLPALITTFQLHALRPLHDIILGLIVFTIGGSFRLELMRKIGPKLLCISSFEIGLTGLLVGLMTFLAGAPLLEAAFLSVVAVTTAPAATQMVMREYQSEGPLTETILPLIGINNFVAIAAFILLIHSGLNTGGTFLNGIMAILASFGLGGVFGLVIAVMDQRLTRQVERQMLVLAVAAVTIGTAERFGLSAILSVLAAGVLAVNTSPHDNRILEDLAAVDYPLYVLFFVMAGAELHLDYLPYMGLVGAGYVVARTIGKYCGCRAGAAAAGATQTIKTWLGPAMLAQAGLAIGLAGILSEAWPGPGKELQTVILACVVVFELVGPLLTRFSLVNAGEVTVLNLLMQRSPVGLGEGLYQVLNHFKKSTGIFPASGAKHPSDILVGHIMRRNVETLSNKAPFDEVLKALGKSRYDRLPVVSDQNELVGVIKYSDIANTLFDPALRNLVVADEIATNTFLKLTPEDTLEKAMAALKAHPDDTYLFVVEKNNPEKLVGVVRQNDVLSSPFSFFRAKTV